MAAYPMSTPMVSKVPYFERVLRGIDAGPAQPIYQVVIGFLVVPAFTRTALFDRGGQVDRALAALCLAAGALGFVFWRRISRSLPAPAAPQGR